MADQGDDALLAAGRLLTAGPIRSGALDRQGRIDLARVLAGDPSGVPADPVLVGGRVEGLRRLDAIDPVGYAQTRNHLGGRVTGLSPWIRHGILTLAEVRDRALHVGGTSIIPADCPADPHPAAKLVAELGWRDYWRRVHASLGEAIDRSIEPPAAVRRTDWIDDVPADVLDGGTGHACVDAFVDSLHRSGWLHNHARMWLASWLVHVRGVRWQAGAAWFLSHLLDGDPASNSLSWQWVAGTFSAKPYLFNRENLERHSDGVYCRTCSLLGGCSIEGGYDEISSRVFVSHGTAGGRPAPKILPAARWQGSARPSSDGPTLVWLTLDSLGAVGPAVATHPEAPKLFVFDPEWIEAERPSVKRLVFILECLADLPDVEIVVGDPAKFLPERAVALGCRSVAVADTPCPRIRRAAAAMGHRLPVTVYAWPTFVDDTGIRDLGRFSRYWRDAEASVMRPSG